MPPRSAEPYLRALGLEKHIVEGEPPPEPPRVGEGYWQADLFKHETFEVTKVDDDYVRALARLGKLRDLQARRKRDESIDNAYYRSSK